MWIFFFLSFNFPCNLTRCRLGDFDTIFVTQFLKSTVHYILPRDQPLSPRKNAGSVMIPQFRNPLAKLILLAEPTYWTENGTCSHRIPSFFRRKFVPNIEHNYSKSRSHIRLLSCKFHTIFIFVLLVSLSMMNVGSSFIFILTISLTRDLYKLSLCDAQ